MTYEQAIEFFAEHGGLGKNLRGQSPTSGQLIRQVPTEKQLVSAAQWAIHVKKQPQATVDEAVRVIMNDWPSAFSPPTEATPDA